MELGRSHISFEQLSFSPPGNGILEIFLIVVDAQELFNYSYIFDLI